MTLHDYLAALRAHWILLIALFLLGSASAYAYAQSMQPIYRSQTQVIVIPARGDSTMELVQGASYVQGVVQTYTILAASPTVLQPVIDNLGLDESVHRLAQRMTVDVPLDTVVINIGVEDVNPESARKTADEIAHQLSLSVAKVSPLGENDEPALRIETITPARVPTVPISPNTRNFVAVGAASGLTIAAAIAVIRRQFLQRVSTMQSLSDFDVPVLGEIPATTEGRSIAQSVRMDPDARISEAVRKISANLQFLNLDTPRSALMIASGSSAEGKTSVSLGLAMSLAEAGKSVAYIEADMRRPGAASYTRLDNSVGLTAVLLGEVSFEDAVQRWGRGNLDIMTCGALPPNPGRLLASGELRAVIEEARARYDHVIVDSAPVLSVSDALWLSELVDGSIVVVRSRRTKVADTRRVIATLEATPTPVLGIIVNGIRGKVHSPYYSDAVGNRDTVRRLIRLG